MFMTFLGDYYEFFIILIGIIIGMVLAYIIFFKPNNAHNNHDELKDDKTEDDTDDSIDLSFGKFDEDPNDEYFSGEKEEFVLGENSNILESMKAAVEEDKDRPANFQVDDDQLLTDNKKIVDEFSEDDEEVAAEIEDSEESKNYEEIDSFDIDDLDPESRLNKIVSEVIPYNDYINQNIGKYHVLFRKDDQRWYVKREGKEEIEKFLITQKEAIAYATIQALIYATTIVVHDEDGKIAKYEF